MILSLTILFSTLIIIGIKWHNKLKNADDDEYGEFEKKAKFKNAIALIGAGAIGIILVVCFRSYDDKICDRCGKEIVLNNDFSTIGGGKYLCTNCYLAGEKEKREQKQKDEYNNQPSRESVTSNDPYEGAGCRNCNAGRYHDGYCDRCGGASRSEVRRHRENADDCSLCDGTGIETNSVGNGRICPACNGKGKVTY
jgi:hypothetical protein